jgi:AraC-like DNA-binding protein
LYYFRLVTDSGHYELSAAGGATVLAFRPEASLAVTPQLCDFVVAVPFQYGRRNVADFRVLEVLLPYPEPAHEHKIVHFFGTRVRFAARALGLVFADELMAAPLRAAAPPLARLLEGVAAARFAALPSNCDALGPVRRALHDALRAGDDASLDAVARRLGLTPRALQRHLKAQGSGYAAELDIVRRDLALVLIAQRLTLQEVAFLVGFSEAAAFHRAFRRWTGEAPGHYRSRIWGDS